MTQRSRRTFLQTALLGGGAIALRSLATGLSTSFLLEGTAAAAPTDDPTFLLLATASNGDPLNIGAPGSLVDAGLRSAYDARHAAAVKSAKVAIGGTEWDAAAPWATLPIELRNRLAFIHHRTNAVTHPEHGKVLRVFDAMRGSTGNGVEMLPSAIASELATALGTIQSEPMVLGPEAITYESRYVQQLSPTELKTLVSGSHGPLANFALLRDKTLDAIYKNVRANGTKAQKSYLDRVALSRSEAAQLGDQLAVDLQVVPVTDPKLVTGLVDDYPLDPVDQILTAIATFKYKLSPVATIHLPFGGDNHHDVGFEQESLELQGGVRMLQLVWEKLNEAGLAEKTTFAMLNTFGRTLATTDGRAHNGGHHVMPMFGPKIKAGVVGGPKSSSNDWVASAFSSTTGRTDGATDVAEGDTFAAAARTLMRATGVSQARVNVRLPGVTIGSVLG